ncbi:MAG: PQQ-binding-like beta-propeller repeat protein [Verrucomicrobiota bacterium]|nr:PQQ-binding-like beta-propeller repeat protein [Verrucomicrobiota bacterium]
MILIYRTFLFSSVVIHIFGVEQDWPRWRGLWGDGTWDGPKLKKDLSVDGLKMRWKKQVSPGYSGVTVANGLAYLMDKPPITKGREVERVICIDVENGELVWEFSYSVTYEKLDYGKGPRASVTIENGYAYGLGAMGHAYCLKADTGKKVWFRNLVEEEDCPPPIWGFSSSPEPLNDVMLYHVGGRKGNVIALNPATGITLWQTGGDNRAGYAPPIRLTQGSSKVLLCWGPNKIMGLPVGGGQELWSIPYEVKYGVSIAKPILKDDIALVCGYWNGSRAIKIENSGTKASLLWSEEEKIRGLMSQPLCRDGTVYLLDRTYGLTAFELQTGKILWRDEHNLTASGRNPHASLVWLQNTGGQVLSLNAEGELVFLTLSPAGYLEHWREQIVGETWSHPAYSGNKVLARDDRNIFCWELPVQKIDK